VRIVPKTEAVARAALEELLKGPTDREKADKYFTAINPGVEIQKLVVENGIAKVDFNETLDNPGGGSCRVSAIRTQITQTLKQFPTVKDVIISIDGRIEDILQP
jgi:spore germination protein GerM